MAAKAAGISDDDFCEWSSGAKSYKERDARTVWASIKSDGGIGQGTLFRVASANGWKGRGHAAPISPTRTPASPVPRPLNTGRGSTAGEVWERSIPATTDHGYIAAKKGTPDGLRVLPESDPLTIAGQRMAGALVVPVMPLAGGEPVSLQFIPPPGPGKKLNLPGASIAGIFVVGAMAPTGIVYLCEGIGQAWACWKATGSAAVVCFGWMRVRAVARELRAHDAKACLVIVPDVGKEADAEAIAREVEGSLITMPTGWERNADVNDYALREGFDSLEVLLSSARRPPVDLPLDVVFADELPATFAPPDELVQGVLTVEGGSVLYGDSNSGKTFCAIDLACAVARGVPWLGRRTEAGLVVYLAAESPASVRGRLQAYQGHHGIKVPNFAIVQSPIDLFDGEADSDAVIELVRLLVAQRGRPVRLIVGDTSARLSAGANENAGQDMGLVVRRIDRIRSECRAHFMLVYHSGKSMAAGARGWSGIRAAIDTEIEVTDSPTSRCAEITKQRDLSTKGERIGFRLDVIHLGTTKWGSAATSCVVAPADAPPRVQSKRRSEVSGAIVEMLTARGSGIKKADLVNHFEGRYTSAAVYKELKKLREAEAVLETAGVVALKGKLA